MKRKYLGRLHDWLVMRLRRRLIRGIRRAMAAGDKDEARSLWQAHAHVAQCHSDELQASHLERIRRG